MWREALQGNRFLARFPVPCLGLQGRLGLCRCTSTCAVPQAYAAPPLECIRGFGYAYGPRQSLRSLLHPWAAAVAFVGFTPCFACCAGLRRDLIGHVNVGLTQNGAWRAPLHPNVCVSFIAVISAGTLARSPSHFHLPFIEAQVSRIQCAVPRGYLVVRDLQVLPGLECLQHLEDFEHAAREGAEGKGVLLATRICGSSQLRCGERHTCPDGSSL